jgi:hypothetical protein
MVMGLALLNFIEAEAFFLNYDKNGVVFGGVSSIVYSVM